MTYTFTPMTEAYARRIVASWRYDGDYAIYDYANEADHVLDREAWGRGLFAVLDEAGELCGELSIEFYDERDEPTPYRDFDDRHLLDRRQMWLGFGMRPDRVGRGLGVGFVRACVDFAVDHFNYQGEYVGLGVAQFNQRAIKTYERAGFRVFHHTSGTIAGRSFSVVHMRKYIQDNSAG